MSEDICPWTLNSRRQSGRVREPSPSCFLRTRAVPVFKRQPIIGALVMIVAVCFVLGEERYVDKENIGTINVFPPTFSF